IVMHVTGEQTIDKQARHEARGLGYSYVVDKDGTIYQFGDPEKTRTNQIQASRYRTSQLDLTNRNALGVGFITGGGQPTKAQMQAANKLVPYLQQRHNIQPGRVYGHGEIQGDDPERSHLGPGRSPEGAVMAAPFRNVDSADRAALDRGMGREITSRV